MIAKILLLVTPILILGNLLVLDVWMWRLWKVIETGASPAIPPTAAVGGANLPATSPTSANFDCPVSCLTQINDASSSLNFKVSQLEQKLIQQGLQPAPTPLVVTQVIEKSAIKEFFIPLGSGSSAAGDWEDVPGVQAWVDSSQYTKIKNVTFEISLRIPTGNQTAWARLFNAIDNHPVWFSDVSLDGGTPKLLISAPITLGTGNKLYKVQLKNQLKYPTYVDQARLHITVN